jgi:hypothetical protein
MKYSERFFEFPVRIYDRFEAQKAEKEEQEEKTPMEGAWISGRMRMGYQDIKSWSDYFDSIQGVEGVEQEGFKFTLVWANTGEIYISTWKRAKFEKELNDYVDKYESWRASEIELLQDQLIRLTNSTEKVQVL